MDQNRNNDVQRQLERLLMQKRLPATVSAERSELKVASRRRIKLPTQEAEDKNSGLQGAKTEVDPIQLMDLGKGAQRPPKKEAKFEETHKRFTSYLEFELLDTIQRLSKNGEIKSMTAILNDAVYEYIHKYFLNELEK